MLISVFLASSDCSWIEMAVVLVFSRFPINYLLSRIDEGSASESSFNNEDYSSSSIT
jgi:hypothetical protein